MTQRPSIDLAAWYPLLVGASIPTPRTEIVHTEVELNHLLDGITPPGFAAFIADLRQAGDRVGWPAFLRTGYGSGKHDYLTTCFVPGSAKLAAHVAALVEWSALADIVGLPVGTWAIRELLPIEAPFTAFRGLPIAKERRYWIADGQVIGHHSYWPAAAIEGASRPDWQERLEQLNREDPAEVTELTALSARVAAVVPGAWSVDWLWSPGRGWICIDLAWAERSFGWEAIRIDLDARDQTRQAHGRRQDRDQHGQEEDDREELGQERGQITKR
jgi:hypothetical protein